MLQVLSLFDAYSLRARLVPALLLVLPTATVIALLFPGVYGTLSRTFGSLGVAAAGLFLLAHVIRARGRQLEKILFSEWGGIPTSVWLRHRDSSLDSTTKIRYHKFLTARIAGLQMPSPAMEDEDPTAADKGYASAVKWLLEFTRNTKLFPLVFNENVSYGFRRNTLAAKPVALWLSGFLSVLTAWITYRRYGWNIEIFGNEVIAAWTVVVICALLWILLVTKAWVKDGAHAYARALLAACEDVSSAPT